MFAEFSFFSQFTTHPNVVSLSWDIFSCQKLRYIFEAENICLNMSLEEFLDTVRISSVPLHTVVLILSKLIENEEELFEVI